MNYAAALRAIGQDLHSRGLKTFELRTEGNEFVAECGYQGPPAETPVSLLYTARDLENLDSQGQTQRGRYSSSEDFWNLAQALRTVGAYLDKNRARLQRVTNNHLDGEECSYRVESLNANGEKVVDVWSQSALYEVCVMLYKRRQRPTGTGGRRR